MQHQHLIYQLKELEELVIFQIDKTNKLIKQHSQRRFDKLNLGITVEQWIILKIIFESGVESQKEIAELSLRDPASITRTIDLLVKKDFVKREFSQNSRRQFKVLLTVKGKAFVKKQMPMIKDERSLSIKGLSQSEIESLKDMLLRIQKNMS